MPLIKVLKGEKVLIQQSISGSFTHVGMYLAILKMDIQLPVN